MLVNNLIGDDFMCNFNQAQSTAVEIETIFTRFLPDGKKYGNADEIRKNPYKVLTDVLECCGSLFQNNSSENLTTLSEWCKYFEGKSMDEILASDLKEDFEKFVSTFCKHLKTIKK